ncbi:MAG: AAA family ATPase [Hyphomonadaceae bacterium]|nr:AAA family ATPase [Hyphomonadaceae bacterium]MBY0565248.1 AAA family ATPase [Hyphomonadaceae bacterium]
MDPKAEPKIVPLRRTDDETPDLWAPGAQARAFSAPEEGGGDQIWGFIGILLRRWMIALPIALVVFALSYGSAALSPKIYQATALLLINPVREQVITDQELVTRSSSSDDAIDSEIEVMRSPDVMIRVVDALRLDEDPEWNGMLRVPSGLERLIAPIVGAIANRSGGAPQSSPEANLDALSVEDRTELRQAIARRLAREVSAQRRGTSFVIEVSARSLSRPQAAAIANATAQAYLDQQTESQFSATERAQDFLRTRATELAVEVQQKERAAEEFRVANGLPSFGGGDQPADVQTMLAQARADLTEKQARLGQVEALIARGGSPDLIAGAANSALLQQLRGQEAELQRRQVDIEERYGARHPDVLSGRLELQTLRARIVSEIERVTTGLRNEVEVARRRLASLQQNFGAETLTLDAANNEAVIQYRQLIREAEAARSVHQSFIQRVEEVESQAALPSANARVMTSATPPGRPASPNMQSALQSAIIFALLLGVGAAFLVETLDRTVSSPQDVERKVSKRAVAAMPKLGKVRYRTLPPLQRHPAGYVVEKPMSDFAEAFRVLRTSVVHARIDKRVQVIAVTSALANEGKTTVALCLGRVAAMAGQRVALVDCDLRRQSLADLMGLSEGTGLVGALTSDLPWSEVFQQDEETSLQVLTGRAAAFTPLDVFSSRAMAEFMGELREAFDLIILDCAPVLHVADTRTVAAGADLTVMVVRADKTPAAAVKSAMRELEIANAEIHGVALNCVAGADARIDYYGSLHYGNNKYYAY